MRSSSGAGNRVDDVGGSDEDHVAEVELDLEVVVAERVVLRGVEHFQQRGSGVATPTAGTQLVDLVEQHDGVHRAGLDDRPRDATGLAADVCAPVAADLGLVAHAAQGDAHELAAHRPGDRLAEAGLANTWRPDQRHDGTRLPGCIDGRVVVAGFVGPAQSQLADGEELDDAIFHLVEAVVVGVEHLTSRVEVELIVASCVPRQLEDAIEPRADPGMLRRLLARALQPVDLLVDGVGHLLGQLQLGNLGAVLADDIVVTLAEFFADRRQLLAQQVLALLLVDTLGDVGADLCRDLKLGEMILGPRHDQIDAFAEVDRRQHRRLMIGIGFAPGRDGIGELAGIGNAAQDLGEPAAAAQLGDLFQHDAQLACCRLDSWRGPGIDEQHQIGMIGAALARVTGDDAPGPRPARSQPSPRWASPRSWAPGRRRRCRRRPRCAAPTGRHLPRRLAPRRVTHRTKG